MFQKKMSNLVIMNWEFKKPFPALNPKKLKNPRGKFDGYYLYLSKVRFAMQNKTNKDIAKKKLLFKSTL